VRAAVLTSVPGALEVETLADPSPGPNEVLIDVRACGVCHTDLHVLKGEVGFPTPCVLGHEVAGVVREAGPGVDGFDVGTSVVGCFIMPCGTCRHCVLGHEDLCETFFTFNRLRGVLYDGESRLRRLDGSPVWMYSMGGLAEQCVIPTTAVYRMPDGVSFAHAAVLGCSAFTALGAVRNVGRVRVGETVAVIAIGGVGANVIQLSAAFGAARIIAIDVADEKLDLARRMGATHVVDGREHDVVDVVRGLTNGRGVDVAFEALGRADTVATAIDVVDDGGRVVLVGIAPAGERAQFEITRTVRRKLQILGSYGGRARADMPVLLDLVARGRLNLDGLVSARFALEEAQHAYDLLDRGQIVGRAVIEWT
jgi:succinate semialdehyde reductase (NADPH)